MTRPGPLQPVEAVELSELLEDLAAWAHGGGNLPLEPVELAAELRRWSTRLAHTPAEAAS